MDEYAIVHFSLCKTIGFLAIFLHEMHETCCKIVRKLQPREYTQGRWNQRAWGRSSPAPLDFGRCPYYYLIIPYYYFPPPPDF